MHLYGLQKLTLLDFPGHLAAIVFLGGCNFRCPFCQNSSLVLSPGEITPLSLDEFRAFLKKRSGILEGICVSGGEPTLHQELPDFLSMIRQEGYRTKLDTNGTNPDMLQSLIQEGLLDYAAMDIKAGRHNYATVCGLTSPPHPHDKNVPVPDAETSRCSSFDQSALLEKIDRSIEMLKNSTIDYEFRTTVVGGLHTAEDFQDIAHWISGCRRYYLQSFRNCPEVLQTNHNFYTFSPSEMQEFLAIVQKEIPQASLRGD